VVGTSGVVLFKVAISAFGSTSPTGCLLLLLLLGLDLVLEVVDLLDLFAQTHHVTLDCVVVKDATWVVVVVGP
jgi:hypothetical protein